MMRNAVFGQGPPVTRPKGVLVLCLAVCALRLSLSAGDHKPTITTFDATPDAMTGPLSINAAGTIAGGYVDRSGYHGFLRARNGTITTFDATPDAVNGSPAFSINPAGPITGLYEDARVVDH